MIGFISRSKINNIYITPKHSILVLHLKEAQMLPKRCAQSIFVGLSQLEGHFSKKLKIYINK